VTKAKQPEELALANPAYLAGKTAYWMGIPSDATSHCSAEVKTAWVYGWRAAESEHLHLRSQTYRNRRDISAKHGDSVLQ
jgi:hypothetical protein